MFMAFVSNPCTQIYIPLNVYTSKYLVFIDKIELATEEITSPWTRNSLVTNGHWPPQIKMIPQYYMYIEIIIINLASKNEHVWNIFIWNHLNFV